MFHKAALVTGHCHSSVMYVGLSYMCQSVSSLSTVDYSNDGIESVSAPRQGRLSTLVDSTASGYYTESR